MSEEIFLSNTSALNASTMLLNGTNFLPASPVCTFKELTSISDLIALFQNRACYRHTIEYTIFLCIANFVILAFGIIGNSLVIYVTIAKLKTKTASSIFILNLAIADMLVILCCIPATLMSNLFIPWVLGETMCRITAYGQGTSVFCSVYSLVAISFDRFRAIHQVVGALPNISIPQAFKTVLFIWIFGLSITLPWAVLFQIVTLNPYQDDPNLLQSFLPFCQEIWPNKTQEANYFLVVHVFACFLLPIILITMCNITIWRNVLKTHSSDLSPTSTCGSITQSSKPSPREIQRHRKLRLLKMFTGLTFSFFMCWLPLYVLMARVKLYYTDDFTGTPFEQKWVPVLVPAAQLLGSCNSCVNPVLYALLNHKFRQSFKEIFACRICSILKTKSFLRKKADKSTSIAVVVPGQGRGFQNTPV